MKILLTYLIIFISTTVLIYYVNQESGIATTTAMIIIYMYTLTGVHGNKLYSDKLHSIIINLNDAIRLIQKRIS